MLRWSLRIGEFNLIIENGAIHTNVRGKCIIKTTQLEGERGARCVIDLVRGGGGLNVRERLTEGQEKILNF